MEIHITDLSAPKLGSSGEKLSEGGKKKNKKKVSDKLLQTVALNDMEELRRAEMKASLFFLCLFFLGSFFFFFFKCLKRPLLYLLLDSDVSHTLLLIIELLLPAFLPSQAGIGVLQPRPSSKLHCGREHAY